MANDLYVMLRHGVSVEFQFKFTESHIRELKENLESRMLPRNIEYLALLAILFAFFTFDFDIWEQILEPYLGPNFGGVGSKPREINWASFLVTGALDCITFLSLVGLFVVPFYRARGRRWFWDTVGSTGERVLKLDTEGLWYTVEGDRSGYWWKDHDITRFRETADFFLFLTRVGSSCYGFPESRVLVLPKEAVQDKETESEFRNLVKSVGLSSS